MVFDERSCFAHTVPDFVLENLNYACDANQDKAKACGYNHA
jgi:hypothetical protein